MQPLKLNFIYYMDYCLQQKLPDLAQILEKQVVDGECCITQKEEEYLNTRAKLAYHYTNYTTQIRHITQSIGYSQVPERYKLVTKHVLSLIHDNSDVFKPGDRANIYVLIGFFCAVRLKNTTGGKDNLIVYIVPDSVWGVWKSVKEWTGLLAVNKWLGYNNYLPYDQY